MVDAIGKLVVILNVVKDLSAACTGDVRLRSFPPVRMT